MRSALEYLVFAALMSLGAACASAQTTVTVVEYYDANDDL